MPNFTPERAPCWKLHRPSSWPYFSLSLVFAGLAPKIQSSVVPAKLETLPLGKETSTGEPMPFILYVAPVLNTSPSNTACLGVSPLPSVLPILPESSNRSDRRQRPSSVTNSVSENVPGR